MPEDEFRIDSHKLIFHPKRVIHWMEAANSWEKAKSLYPIYIEISPAGSCNHRCAFCAMDFMEYRARFLQPDLMREAFVDMAENGVRSVMLAGEGEPFLHRHTGRLARTAHEAGLDVAFTTNGSLLTPEAAEQILPVTAWIKTSIDAGTPETHARLHGTHEGEFARILYNLSRAVQYRDENGLSCTLGAQMLVLPDNVDEIGTLVELCRDHIGLDYLVLKPYSHHLFSNNHKYADLEYGRFLDALSALANASSERFRLIYRKDAFENQVAGRHRYDTCCSVPFFWAYLTSNHDLYACSAYLGDPRFLLGNLRQETFSDIWEGERRRTLFRMMRNDFDVSRCRLNCRMNAINAYLWNLEHPPPHVNFI